MTEERKHAILFAATLLCARIVLRILSAFGFYGIFGISSFTGVGRS